MIIVLVLMNTVLTQLAVHFRSTCTTHHEHQMLLQSPPTPPPWLKGAHDGHDDAFTLTGHDDDDAQNHDKDEDDDD